MLYDVIIVGAGPAGLTAAIYARRAEKSVLVLEKETFGGQITYSPKVENYPGFLSMSGNEFAELLIGQVSALGADIEIGEAAAVHVRDGIREVETSDGAVYTGKTVILAAGSRHRHLGLDREEELTGSGVSYCAVCDGAFYRGQDVAVIGGGNTALQDAVLLAESCHKVTVVQNLATLTGEKRLADLLQAKDNVEIICNTVVTELIGNDALRAIRLKNTETGAESELHTDGIFIAIGQVPENQPFAAVASLNEAGYFASGEDCRTETPGVFVAGDCRAKAVRQITTAVGDGASAALAAVRYLDT